MIKLLKTAYANNSKAIRVPLIISLVLELGLVILLYFLNKVRGGLYDALPTYEVAKIWLNLSKFAGIAMLLVVTNGYLGFYLNRLGFLLREGLTKYFMKNKDLLHLPALHEQRVQEDFKKFGEQTIDIIFTILKSTLNLLVFVGVIVSLTQWWVGLLIVGAVVGGTLFTKFIGKPLVVAQSKQETNEAQFRLHLNDDAFSHIKSQFKITNMLYKRMSFTQAGLGQAFTLLPFIILLPMYTSKALTMGAFMQSVEALGRIIDALSVLIDNRQTIVNIQTCLIRLNFIR